MLAIIPARGGSKGLAGKNIRMLAGIPLIAHTIKAALASKYLDKIIVSTDDKDIYDIAISYGAEPSFLRPSHLATDDAKAIDTYLYSVERLNLETGSKYDEVVILQPTSPLRLAEDIDGAIELFNKNAADSVISYTEEYHPISWHKFLSSDLRLEPIFPDSLNNRQALRKSYYPNGAVYVFKTELLKKNTYSSDQTFAYIMPHSRSVDIDTIEDFEYASFLMRNNK